MTNVPHFDLIVDPPKKTMTEQICPYCLNEIRPLDKHVTQVKKAGREMQEVTCVLTRIVVVKVEQTK